MQKIIKLVLPLILLSSPSFLLAQNSVNSAIVPPKIIFPEINKNFSAPKKLGNHDLKVFGFNVYNIQLFSDKDNFSYQNKLAIVINYKRDFSKNRLVERSIQEISRINNIKDQNLLAGYAKKLNEIFFDVKKGDRKTAYFDPKSGAKLYFNGEIVGQIEDILFATRFMDIWLSADSSYPQMTKDITGKNE